MKRVMVTVCASLLAVALSGCSGGEGASTTELSDTGGSVAAKEQASKPPAEQSCEHQWVAATCTVPPTCSECGATEGEPAGHQMGGWQASKEATCAEAGIETAQCAVCGEAQERETEKAEHSPGKWKTVSKPSVDPDGDITPGKKVKECKVCGEEIDSKETTIEATKGQLNALRKAGDYLDLTAFSKKGLADQLEFEKFSKEDAEWAVKNCGADWKEQAAKKAQDYLDMMSFSRDGLIDQLEFEGFTHKQAVYGVDKVGL